MKHTRLALFILALVAIVVTFALCNQSVKEAAGQEISYPAGPVSKLMPLDGSKGNLVRCNGNWTELKSGTGAYTTSTNDWREYFILAHASRLRQTGNIEQIRMAWPGAGSIPPDTVIVKFWRWNVGSYYDLVAVSENIGTVAAVGHRILTNATTKITLDTPIAVVEGDYYSLHLAESGGMNNVAITAEWEADDGNEPPGNESMIGTNRHAGMFFARNTGGSIPSGNYNWGRTGEAGANVWLEHDYFPIEFYMKAPQVVMLGASIITGHNEHRSFWENTTLDSAGTPAAANFIMNDSATTALDSTPAWYINGTGVLDVSTAWPYSALRPATNYTGWSFQNMGKSSDMASTLLNTFTIRCTDLHPRLAFIGVGSADVNSGVTPDTHANQMTELMDSLDSHNIIGVFRGIVPRTVWNPGDAVAVEIAKNDTVDVYNKIVADVVRQHHLTSANGTQMFYVPVYHKLGKDNPNSWPNTIRNDYHDLITLYANTDTIHLNGTGAKLMSEELIKVLRRP